MEYRLAHCCRLSAQFLSEPNPGNPKQQAARSGDHSLKIPVQHLTGACTAASTNRAVFETIHPGPYLLVTTWDLFPFHCLKTHHNMIIQTGSAFDGHNARGPEDYCSPLAGGNQFRAPDVGANTALCTVVFRPAILWNSLQGAGCSKGPEIFHQWQGNGLAMINTRLHQDRPIMVPGT